MFIEKKRGPYFLQNKQFGTITIIVSFPYEYKDEDFMKSRLIKDVINRSNNYKEKKDFKKVIIDNYIVNLSSYIDSTENTRYMFFELTIPNPKKLSKISLEKTISILADYIYNPYTENDGLEKFSVEKFINLYHKNIKERENVISGYASRRLYEICAPNTKLSMNMANHEYLLDKVTSKNLYEFYQKNIIEGNPFVFVMGDVNQEKITKLIEKYIFKKKEEIIKISKIQNHFLESKEFQAITEEKDFFQSCIALVYKVKNMREKDRYTLSAINKLLSSQSSDILLKKMRLENDLVYTTSSHVINRYGLLILTALIERNSKDKAVQTLKEVIELLKNEDYIKPLLKNIKEKERIELIKDKDRKNTLINDFIDKTLEIYKGNDDYYKKLCRVTTGDIADIASRLVLDTEYFVRGNKNAK